MRQNFNRDKKRREEAKKKKRDEKMAKRLAHKAEPQTTEPELPVQDALPEAPPQAQ